MRALPTSEISSWQDTQYVPWWWLPTVTALKSMASAAGFQVLDGSSFWNDNAYVLLLQAGK